MTCFSWVSLTVLLRYRWSVGCSFPTLRTPNFSWRGFRWVWWSRRGRWRTVVSFWIRAWGLLNSFARFCWRLVRGGWFVWRSPINDYWEKYFQVGQFSYIVMGIVAPFHKALMAFEEIGTELGTGKGHFQESFLNIAVIQRLHKYKPK